MSPDIDADASDVSTGIMSTETPGMSRRRFIAGGAGVAGLTGLAGCSGLLGSSKTSEQKVTWLLTPTENPEELKKQYQPMIEYVANEVSGVEMEVNVATDYSAILPALKSGKAEIAFDDISLISAPDKLDVLGTMVTSGTAYYFSMIVVKKDSPYQRLTDLKGETISFCDVISTSGSIFPLYALREAGLDIGGAPQGKPEDFKGQWSTHDQSLETLFNRPEVKANANGGQWTIPYMTSDQLPKRVREISAFANTVGEKSNKLKPLWWSNKIPKQPVITRADWKSDKRKQVRDAMAKASQSKLKEYQKGDTQMSFTAIQKTSIDEYQPVINRVNELGIDLTQD